jgi:hypothetical protein
MPRPCRSLVGLSCVVLDGLQTGYRSIATLIDRAATDPRVSARIVETWGKNLVDGLQRLIHDKSSKR